jgi:hypothetical protein
MRASGRTSSLGSGRITEKTDAASNRHGYPRLVTRDYSVLNEEPKFSASAKEMRIVRRIGRQPRSACQNATLRGGQLLAQSGSSPKGRGQLSAP